MGGGNPIKKIVKDVFKAGGALVGGAGRLVGADLGGLQTTISDTGRYAGLGVDVVSGKAKQMKREAEGLASRQADAARVAAGLQAKSAADAASAAVEQERISQDTSKSQTLLTGGLGLEDDENSTISRRTLTGR